LGCFINIIDEKLMPVIIELFIGRWYGVVNVKVLEERSWKPEDRKQMTDGRQGLAECFKC